MTAHSTLGALTGSSNYLVLERGLLSHRSGSNKFTTDSPNHSRRTSTPLPRAQVACRIYSLYGLRSLVDARSNHVSSFAADSLHESVGYAIYGLYLMCNSSGNTNNSRSIPKRYSYMTKPLDFTKIQQRMQRKNSTWSEDTETHK